MSPLRSFSGIVGGLIVLLVVGAAVLAPVASPFDPDALDVLHRFASPGPVHWLGTDQLGRDLFSRLMWGASVAMAVSLSAISLALAGGTLLGVLAAFVPSRWEWPILMVFDIVASFPSLVLALVTVAVLGPSTRNVVLIVAVTLAPQFGRVARAQALGVAASAYVEAERILGASPGRILFVHVLPNIAGPLIVLASIEIPVVVTIEAGLSFVGLGVRPPLASWGALINDGYSYLSDSTVPIVVSSLALAVATLGFTLFGEALRDAIDPRMRRIP